MFTVRPLVETRTVAKSGPLRHLNGNAGGRLSTGDSDEQKLSPKSAFLQHLAYRMSSDLASKRDPDGRRFEFETLDRFS